MKTESTKTQEKKLETLEEAAMVVLNEFAGPQFGNWEDTITHDIWNARNDERLYEISTGMIGFIARTVEARCKDYASKRPYVTDEMLKTAMNKLGSIVKFCDDAIGGAINDLRHPQGDGKLPPLPKELAGDL